MCASSSALRSSIVPCVPFDKNGELPFYQQIYSGYRDAIVSGLMGPGQRLPSSRALAAELGISRLPVVNAFDQLLHEGYLIGRVGSGTFVSEQIPDELARPASSGLAIHVSPEQRGESKRLFRKQPEAFRVSLPALDEFPHTLWARLVSKHARNVSMEMMAYGDPRGHYPLRYAIANYLRTARAVLCGASQVIVVSGSQMALQLCARVLVQAGDHVFLEEPGYPGARAALSATGGKLIPIPLDAEGISVRALQACGKRTGGAVYVTPSHQYPLGTSMTAARRLELLQWAKATQSWILEDDYDSEYRYASRPLGALQGMDSASRVVYIGTFSKVLFPALRVGYLVVPSAMTGAFVRAREAMDIFSPTLYQAALAEFLEGGHFARHLRRMRGIYLERRNALIAGIEQVMGGMLELGNTDAGMHLTTFLPDQVDDRLLVQQAASAGVSAAPLSRCYLGKQARSGLILGFGGARPRQVRPALQKLEALIREATGDHEEGFGTLRRPVTLQRRAL
jgi:GntR family transcriptional regulator/MocR family aminotransferase